MNLESNAVSTPGWITDLANLVVEAVTPIDVQGQWGYRWLCPGEHGNFTPYWQIVLYPTTNEVVGGPKDGCQMYPGFKLDVTLLLQNFNAVDSLEWESPSSYTGNMSCPKLYVRGDFTGYPVEIRVLSLSPFDEDSTMAVNLDSGEFWSLE